MIWAVIGTRSSEGSLARLANSPVEKDIFEILGQICLGVTGSWMYPPKKGNVVHILGRDPLGQEQLRAAWSSLLHSQVVTSLPAAAHEHLGTSQTYPSHPSKSIH